MDELVGVNRSLQIYDTPLEQTDGQYEEQKKS